MTCEKEKRKCSGMEKITGLLSLLSLLFYPKETSIKFSVSSKNLKKMSEKNALSDLRHLNLKTST